jgi:iron-sulfur cluster repair protein YtfE (RIC family)
MCDYCGCRSEPEIAALSSDHERMLTLTAGLRRAHATGIPAPELFAELTAMLGPHSLREERGLYPALAAAVKDPEYVAMFKHDHDELDALVTRADTDQHIMRIAALLEMHILREETDLFPAAYQMVGSPAWATIAKSVQHDPPRSEHPPDHHSSIE